MFVVSNRVFVAAGYCEEFERRFRARLGQIDQQPGFVEMCVMQPAKEGAPYVVQTRWQDRAAFDNWVGSEDFRRAHANPLPKEAFSQPGQLEMHEVIISSDDQAG
ncbi:antibiotic biosynthesis monooxygenase family protein [Marinobacterium arenosum]|uniref:antibiotic biosynthesis monooxygenase family protein n=1 Tax=Marinobacterium arenosum TaxID=2862496 RepID=UPI001C982F75|nr:antibiotic biosynthesis monooxygenase [Marinobacterium arenosum]MBY4678492.1 antibiotic biosynthesis monooxygenase [Marinobacterium arenosum]